MYRKHGHDELEEVMLEQHSITSDDPSSDIVEEKEIWHQETEREKDIKKSRKKERNNVVCEIAHDN